MVKSGSAQAKNVVETEVPRFTVAKPFVNPRGRG
jgi:hypothetical protein